MGSLRWLLLPVLTVRARPSSMISAAMMLVRLWVLIAVVCSGVPCVIAGRGTSFAHPMGAQGPGVDFSG